MVCDVVHSKTAILSYFRSPELSVFWPFDVWSRMFDEITLFTADTAEAPEPKAAVYVVHTHERQPMCQNRTHVGTGSTKKSARTRQVGRCVRYATPAPAIRGISATMKPGDKPRTMRGDHKRKRLLNRSYSITSLRLTTFQLIRRRLCLVVWVVQSRACEPSLVLPCI